MATPLILIVEDYPDAREMYAEYLTFMGFHVATAENGQEAIELAFKLKPSLIVMDLALPLLDGWEATRRLKANPKTREIPIVAVSGHALKNEEHGARAAGCDGFVTKPCTPSELLHVISQYITTDGSKALASD